MEVKDLVLKNFYHKSLMEDLQLIVSKILKAYYDGRIKTGATIGAKQFEIRETKKQFIIEFKGVRQIK